MAKVEMRDATLEDVAEVVDLLIDDSLGATRESLVDLAPYRAGFERIRSSAGTRLLVAEIDGRIVGTLTLAILHGLARQGASRAIVEAVRVTQALRGQGIGRQMMDWVSHEARLQGCTRVQLTSDKRRPDAHRFYERLGFTSSHEGFVLEL